MPLSFATGLVPNQRLANDVFRSLFTLISESTLAVILYGHCLIECQVLIGDSDYWRDKPFYTGMSVVACASKSH